ncbi:hypothetical protein [Acidovorax sp. RAC01]|uniref:hypothetical protein n=1 Tax=Acidovorax sp. RAC01 TaxID=1842533 RepID=UPI0008556E3C|nr:hypothetical protein [Acidovorax sp. RAC01]AOG25063.1 hypothetical protein BSY15_3980 [Acidovorax sp. RAC01]
MLDISQTTNLLTSIGVSGTLAARAAERTARDHPQADPLTFLKELRNTLEQLGDPAAAGSPKPTAAAAAQATAYKATTDTFSQNAAQAPRAAAALDTKPAGAPAVAPFSNLEEFRAWEKGLGDTFAADYEPPDYIRVASMVMNGGEDTVVDRYMFFKNHPEFAADYEAIRNGQLSKFPTDGSTLVKSDLTTMSPEIAAYYEEHPEALLAAEGFSMDPTLARQRMTGEIDAPFGVNISEWLTENKWTSGGVVAENNRVKYANADYIGMDGKGAGTYKLTRLDPATGNIINFDGRIYDPVTGEPKA